jgi:hypothetical protein
MTDRYACAKCGAVWTAVQLAPYHDFWSRVQPGEIIPQGDCPACGAFCYPPAPPSTPLHVWTVTHEHQHGKATYVFATEQDAQQQHGRLLCNWLADHLDAFDAATKSSAQAILTHLEQGAADEALYAWTDWRDAHTGRGFAEAFDIDEQVVSPPQTIDAEQLTALRARLVSPSGPSCLHLRLPLTRDHHDRHALASSRASKGWRPQGGPYVSVPANPQPNRMD